MQHSERHEAVQLIDEAVDDSCLVCIHVVKWTYWKSLSNVIMFCQQQLTWPGATNKSKIREKFKKWKQIQDFLSPPPLPQLFLCLPVLSFLVVPPCASLCLSLWAWLLPPAPEFQRAAHLSVIARCRMLSQALLSVFTRSVHHLSGSSRSQPNSSFAPCDFFLCWLVLFFTCSLSSSSHLLTCSLSLSAALPCSASLPGQPPDHSLLKATLPALLIVSPRSTRLPHPIIKFDSKPFKCAPESVCCILCPLVTNLNTFFFSVPWIIY